MEASYDQNQSGAVGGQGGYIVRRRKQSGERVSERDQSALNPLQAGNILATIERMNIRETIAEGKTRGQFRMALSLGPCFPRVIFPVAIAMWDGLEFVARAIEQRIWFGAPFEGTRLATTGSIR